MPILRLLPGATLEWCSHPEATPQQVSDRAHEFLFEPIGFDPATTLADVFGLFQRCPALCDMYRRQSAHRLSKEAAKGPQPATSADFPEDLEFLQLCEHSYLRSGESVYQAMYSLRLFSPPEIRESLSPANFDKHGDSVKCEGPFVSLRQMLALPVRVRKSVLVWEEGTNGMVYPKGPDPARRTGVSLGRFLYGLLSAMTFFGDPAREQEIIECLENELDKRVFSGHSAVDDFLTSTSECRARLACERLFDRISGYRPVEVMEAVRGVDDDGDVADVLVSELGDGVVVAAAYRGLSGRDFRKAVRLLRPDGQPGTQCLADATNEPRAAKC